MCSRPRTRRRTPTADAVREVPFSVGLVGPGIWVQVDAESWTEGAKSARVLIPSPHRTAIRRSTRSAVSTTRPATTNHGRTRLARPRRFRCVAVMRSPPAVVPGTRCEGWAASTSACRAAACPSQRVRRLRVRGPCPQRRVALLYLQCASDLGPHVPHHTRRPDQGDTARPSTTLPAARTLSLRRTGGEAVLA